MHLKYVLVALLCLFVTACRLEIVMPNYGGEVKAKSGDYVPCQTRGTCVIDVVDVYFDQTFVAVPSKGYVFDGWLKQDRGFCGGNKKPCHLFTTTFGPHEALMAFLDNQDEVFYLSPRFNKEGALKVAVSGTWTYLEAHWYTSSPGVSCKASGTLTHWRDKAGHHQKLTPGSELVIGLSPCTKATVTEAPNVFHPHSFSAYKVLSGEEIASWNPLWKEVVVHSSNSYTTKFQFTRSGRSISGETTYTREN